MTGMDRRESDRLYREKNREKCQAFYIEAEQLSKDTGVPHHVDHIIPLQGESVSGLHVENNLQVISGYDNRSKGNKWDAE